MKKRILIGVCIVAVLIAYFLPIVGNDSLLGLIFRGPNNIIPGVLWLFWILLVVGMVYAGVTLYLKRMGGFTAILLGLFSIMVLLYNFLGGISEIKAVGLNILNSVSIGFWLIFVAAILMTVGGVLIVKEE